MERDQIITLLAAGDSYLSGEEMSLSLIHI